MAKGPGRDEIAADLRARMGPGGDLPVGANLPSVNALAAHYGSNRLTVLAARDVLRREGRILAPGTSRKELFLVSPPSPLLLIDRSQFSRSKRVVPGGSTTFERAARSAGWEPQTVYPRVGWRLVPDEIRPLLGVKRDAPVVERYRVRWAAPVLTSGEPGWAYKRVMGLHQSWIPADVAQDAPAVLTQGPCGDGGSYARIEETGRRIEVFEDIISFRLASAEEAAAMEEARRDELPVVVVLRQVIDQDDRVVTVDLETWRAGSVQIKVRYAHED